VEAQATATFLAKADGVLAGLAVANMVCETVDPGLRVSWSLQGVARLAVLLQLHTKEIYSTEVACTHAVHVLVREF
jgi:nicotinate-nucleotide pyrophosphorylase